MAWLSWMLLGLGLMALFVAWDLVFCGGRRCRALIDRLPSTLRSGDLANSGGRSSRRPGDPPKNGSPR